MDNETRKKELAPFIIFIRDYDKVINLPEEEYQAELKQLNIEAFEYFKYEELIFLYNFSYLKQKIVFLCFLKFFFFYIFFIILKFFFLVI